MGVLKRTFLSLLFLAILMGGCGDAISTSSQGWQYGRESLPGGYHHAVYTQLEGGPPTVGFAFRCYVEQPFIYLTTVEGNQAVPGWNEEPSNFHIQIDEYERDLGASGALWALAPDRSIVVIFDATEIMAIVSQLNRGNSLIVTADWNPSVSTSWSASLDGFERQARTVFEACSG